jgi:hypothetical protein
VTCITLLYSAHCQRRACCVLAAALAASVQQQLEPVQRWQQRQQLNFICKNQMLSYALYKSHCVTMLQDQLKCLQDSALTFVCLHTFPASCHALATQLAAERASSQHAGRLLARRSIPATPAARFPARWSARSARSRMTLRSTCRWCWAVVTLSA